MLKEFVLGFVSFSYQVSVTGLNEKCFFLFTIALFTPSYYQMLKHLSGSYNRQRSYMHWR